MSPLLLTALVAILAFQPNVNITRIPAPVKGEVRVLANGSTIQSITYGWTECEVTRDASGKFISGRVVRIVYSEQDPTTLSHEALHGASCVHSGAVGGLLPFPAQTNDPEHEWVAYGLANPEATIKIMEMVR